MYSINFTWYSFSISQWLLQINFLGQACCLHPQCNINFHFLQTQYLYDTSSLDIPSFLLQVSIFTHPYINSCDALSGIILCLEIGGMTQNSEQKSFSTPSSKLRDPLTIGLGISIGLTERCHQRICPTTMSSPGWLKNPIEMYGLIFGWTVL